MSQHSSEITLLLAACRPEPDNQLTPLLQELAGDIDWTRLVEISLEQGVTCLLCNSLLAADQSLVPEEIRNAAVVFLENSDTSNQNAADQLSRILTTLDSAGIAAIPFKGPVLAISAFGRLNLRTFADLDFLIRETQIDTCLSTLRTLGYSHEWNLSPKQWRAFLDYAGQDLLAGPGLHIEPHWAFAPHTMAWDIDYEQLWTRASTETLNG
ncbi:MAG: nucleotidyltransferase family protein, partial [Sedimenticola sp.]